MPSLKKIFPSSSYQSGIQGRINVVILSEGYTIDQKRFFYEDSNGLVESLFDIYPFNTVRASKSHLNFYVHFEASANSGPSINSPATSGRSIFESSLDTASELLTLNNSLINDKIESLTIYDQVSDSEVNLKDLHIKSHPNFKIVLIVILTPKTTGVAVSGGEFLQELDLVNYPFLALTSNGRIGQLLSNYIGSKLGLAPEYDLNGDSHSEYVFDDSFVQNYKHVNVAMESQTSIDYGTQWYSILSKNQIGEPIPIVENLTPATANRDIPLFPSSTDQIVFHEGANGYRRKLYRSAKDCIMRRKIGDLELPLRKDMTCFCPLCRHNLANVFRI